MSDARDELLLEPGDVARLLGVSATWIRMLANSGVLRTAARTRRGCRLYAVADVEKLKQERQRRGLTRKQSVVA